MGRHESFTAWCGLPPSMAALLFDWKPYAYQVDGEDWAIALVSGSEIHFAVAPERRFQVLSRDRIGDFLRPILEERSFLTTRVMRGDGRSKMFVKRLGFELTRSDNFCTYFMLSSVPFERRAKE